MGFIGWFKEPGLRGKLLRAMYDDDPKWRSTRLNKPADAVGWKICRCAALILWKQIFRGQT